MSEDFTAQANRAATELLADIDVSLPVESYEVLHAIAALAYGKGSHEGKQELTAELGGNPYGDVLTDPRDST